MGKGMEDKVFGRTYPDMILTATFGEFASRLPWEPTTANKDFAKERIRMHLSEVKTVNDPSAQVSMAIAETYLSAFGL